MRAWYGTEKGKKWHKFNSPNHNKNIRKWEKKYPKKKKAQQLAQDNIPIPKGKLCEKCNTNLAIQRHHPD